MPAVRVGLVQSSASDVVAHNVERAERGVRDAAARGARIVCLQELFASRYFCQQEEASHFDLAEPVPGPLTLRFGALARELGVVLVVPVFEKRAPGLHHNSAVVIGADGTPLARYRKMHIPDDPSFQEKFYFAPGDLGFAVARTPLANVGTLICWDQWFPEAARLMALGGADILFYPTAIGWLPSERALQGAAQLDAWRTIQRSHAIANGVFVAAVNRVGHEGAPDAGIEFWGNSFVCDPMGVVIAEAGLGEEVLVAECDLAMVERVRRDWPFLRDRRIDAYSGLTARFLDEESH